MADLEKTSQYAQYLVDSLGEQQAFDRLQQERVPLPRGWQPNYDYKRRLELQGTQEDIANKQWQRQYQGQQNERSKEQLANERLRLQNVDRYDVKDDAQGNFFYIPKDPRYGLPTRPVPGSRPGEQLRKPPQMSETTRAGLRDASSIAQKSLYQINTFEPGFGGNVILGDLENTIKRWFPSLEGMTGTKGQADWWSSLQEMDTLIRHPLFGSALTPTEQALWKQTTVGPRDDPQFIQENLQRRAAIMNTAVARITRDASLRNDEKAVLESTGLPRLPGEEMTRPILGKEGLQNRVTQSQSMWQRGPSQEDLEYTAQKHGITVDEVKRRLGAR